MYIKSQIKQLLKNSVDKAISAGLLPATSDVDIILERTQNLEHGDFASSTPLKLSRDLQMSPMNIGEHIVSVIPDDKSLDSVTVAPPGFINFKLKPSWLADQVDVIRSEKQNYGNITLDDPKRIQVEFISSNPTGPLQVANARGAVVGSTLANVLEAAGFYVEREYYINDSGTQIHKFNRSVYLRYIENLGHEIRFPDDGYQGQYIVDMAKQLKQEYGSKFTSISEDDAVRELGNIGLQKMLDSIKADVGLLRVKFDVWFSENSVYENGQYEKIMDILDGNNFLGKKDEAIWFMSTALGDDKDNVLVRSTGSPTYFASDIAYHYNKFVERGFDKVIDIWGADHHGHVTRMKTAIEALGVSSDRLNVIITQMVTLKKQTRKVRLSKRKGEIVTLRELVKDVGADACRFFFLARSHDSHMEFDMELAKRQSSENPVYYIQYAHARIASILRLADEKDIEFNDGDLSLLTHESELDLIRKMLGLPDMIETISRNLEVHHLPHYSHDLATAFHLFYQQCRVVSEKPEDQPITKARLKLIDAVKIVMARCLILMNIDAPEKM